MSKTFLQKLDGKTNCHHRGGQVSRLINILPDGYNARLIARQGVRQVHLYVTGELIMLV